MHQLLHITILLASIITIKAAHINITNVNETQLDIVEQTHDANETAIQIEALQKEKQDLYNKINKAIDEAIPEIEKANDTEAVTALDNLKALRQQLEELHEASSDDDTMETVINTDEKFRRRLSMNIDKKENNDLPNTDLLSNNLPNNNLPNKDLSNNDLPDNDLPYKDSNIQRQGRGLRKRIKNEFLEKLNKSRDKKYTSLPRVVNRQKIAEQIQMWLNKHQEEKQKKRELKLQQKVAHERCPAFGKGKEKKQTKNKQGSERKAKNYPCCRKCCKKSYLGCL